MNESEYNELRAASWRRKPTSHEEELARAYWMANPEAQAEWEEDLALTRQLRELPNAPLASNFTSLVLQAVEASTGPVPASRESLLQSWWHRSLGRLVPRITFAALALSLGAALFFQHQTQSDKRVAGDVREFLQAATLPGPEVFEDFDAIRQLQPVSFSSTDDDLLAALQ